MSQQSVWITGHYLPVWNNWNIIPWKQFRCCGGIYRQLSIVIAQLGMDGTVGYHGWELMKKYSHLLKRALRLCFIITLTWRINNSMQLRTTYAHFSSIKTMQFLMETFPIVLHKGIASENQKLLWDKNDFRCGTHWIEPKFMLRWERMHNWGGQSRLSKKIRAGTSHESWEVCDPILIATKPFRKVWSNPLLLFSESEKHKA